MELTLAILMVLGIFVGVPALIGFAIAGMYILKDNRVRRAEHARTLEEASTEAVSEQAAEAMTEETTKERASVA